MTRAQRQWLADARRAASPPQGRKAWALAKVRQSATAALVAENRKARAGKGRRR